MGARFGAGFKAGKSMRRDARQTPLMSRHPGPGARQTPLMSRHPGRGARQTPLMSRHPGRGARQTPLMGRHPGPEVPVLKALRSSREKS